MTSEAVHEIAAQLFDGAAPLVVSLEVVTSLALRVAELEREVVKLNAELYPYRLVAEARSGR